MKKLMIVLLLGAIGKLGAQTTNIGGMEVDFRILADHTDEDLKEMVAQDPLSVKKLNYYYEQSFVFVASKDQNAAAFDINSVNVKRFEEQRLQSERKQIIVSQYNDYILLKSKDELEQEYKLIK